MLLALVDKIARRVSSPSDEPEVRTQKTLLVLSAILFIPPSLLWSALYFVFNEPLSAAIPLVYVVVTLLGLASFAFTRRFLAGADAIGLAEEKIAKLREDIESHRDLSTSLGITADDNVMSVRVG